MIPARGMRIMPSRVEAAFIAKSARRERHPPSGVTRQTKKYSINKPAEMTQAERRRLSKKAAGQIMSASIGVM
jgi:hypothetical protein